MSQLFSPIRFRGVTLPNRIVVPPMAQYSGIDGCATDWHLVHLGRFAIGGAGMVVVEATAICPEGRATYGDLGLWSDRQIPPLRRIAAHLRENGCFPAIQLGHAGRKAGTQRPWDGFKPLGVLDAELRNESAWPIVSVTSQPADEDSIVPHALERSDIRQILQHWKDATLRAAEAGFDVVEIHGAHGYLLHSFLSPLSNLRSDEYGGSLEARMRLALEVAEVVRAAWPANRPVFFRVSAVDGPEEGWTIEDTVALARELKLRGVEVIDCSSGGIGSVSTRIPRGLSFQVPFAERVRRDADIATMAVGLIVEPAQAAAVVDGGQADLVAVGRQCLEDPNWPLHAYTDLNPAGRYEKWPRQAGWWLARRRM